MSDGVTYIIRHVLPKPEVMYWVNGMPVPFPLSTSILFWNGRKWRSIARAPIRYFKSGRRAGIEFLKAQKTTFPGEVQFWRLSRLGAHMLTFLNKGSSWLKPQSFIRETASNRQETR